MATRNRARHDLVKLGFPHLIDLACALRLKQRDADWNLIDEHAEGWLDVRLQVHDGGWALRTGSSDYDQDHRGYWGSGALGRPARGQGEGLCRDNMMSRADVLKLARGLIDQCEDALADEQSYLENI